MREIYIQKRLSTAPQWVGTVVHELAAWVLDEVRRGHYPPPDRVLQRAERVFRRQLDESSRGLYRANPKRHPGLVEHYYAEEIPDDVWEAKIQDGLAIVRGMFDNRVFLRLTEVPDRIREVEKLSQVRIADTPVWVSPDALVEDAQGGFSIVDWKTGRAHVSEAVQHQLSVYATYALQRYVRADSPPTAQQASRVKTLYANLRSGEHTTFDVDLGGLEATASLIETSAGAMRALIVEGTDNDVREEDFPLLPEGSAECARCAFRRGCGREPGQ